MSKFYTRICNHCGKEYKGSGKYFCSTICSTRPDKTPEQRFWSYVNIPDLFSCWEWTASKRHGYGIIGFGEKTIGAHRFSYLLHYGSIPDGLCVLHKCDNPACVNPAHLYLGTQQDNMNDKVKANRQSHPTGEKSGMSKLTENQVIEIIELLKTKIPQRKLAKKLSINRSLIADINANRTWTHLPR